MVQAFISIAIHPGAKGDFRMTPAWTGPVDSSRTWIVLPTYNEAGNLEPIAQAILEALPSATLLIVDDASPDGTGVLADRLSDADPRVRVLHRPGKEGLGRAYRHGFRVALDGGAGIVVQMDADFSHDPASLPSLVAPIAAGTAELKITSPKL